MSENESPSLELTVTIININYGENAELMEKNADLNGYSILVDKINTRLSEGKDLSDSIRLAVSECISSGVLSEFLTEHREELLSMFSLVYNEDIAREIAREEGREDGIEIGMEKGIGISTTIMRALKENQPEEKIAAQYDVSIQTIRQLKELYNSLIAG